MTYKRKNIFIMILILIVIVLSICLALSINSNKNIKVDASNESQEKIEILNSQLQEYQNKTDDSIVEKENVCSNFLKTYYSVRHSTSKAASLPECKAYLTEQLYNKLTPAEEGTEYSQEDVNVDYTSSISIKKAYQSNSDPNELIIRCTIKKTVNDMQSINEYFVLLKVENINQEWLVSNFELISVQGG